MRLLAAVLLLLVVPTAAGQVTGGLELTVAPPTAPIKPEIENPAFVTEVTVPCEAVVARVSPASPDGMVQVSLEFILSSGVVLTGPLFVMIDPAECVGGAATEVTQQAVFQLSVPRTVVGLQALPATARAYMAPGGPGVDALESDVVPFTVTADAYLVSQVKIDSKLERCDGGKARYDLEVTNYGNVRTQYTFELGSEPSGDGWSATLPEPIVLDTPNHEGGAASVATVPFVVDCPFGNKEGAYQIVVHSAASDDAGKQGNPMTAKVLARSDPPLGIPGPGLFLGILLLGLALLARRRA